MDEKGRVRWTGHQGTLLSMIEILLADESHVDVTLACDGKFIQAHKLILSACSPYFRELLELNNDKHPIIFLRDTPYDELKALIKHMYRGEFSAPHSKIHSIIKIGKDLKIRGLDDFDFSNKSSQFTSSSTLFIPPMGSNKRKRQSLDADSSSYSQNESLNISSSGNSELFREMNQTQTENMTENTAKLALVPLKTQDFVSAKSPMSRKENAKRFKSDFETQKSLEFAENGLSVMSHSSQNSEATKNNAVIKSSVENFEMTWKSVQLPKNSPTKVHKDSASSKSSPPKAHTKDSISSTNLQTTTTDEISISQLKFGPNGVLEHVEESKVDDNFEREPMSIEEPYSIGNEEEEEDDEEIELINLEEEENGDKDMVIEIQKLFMNQILHSSDSLASKINAQLGPMSGPVIPNSPIPKNLDILSKAFSSIVDPQLDSFFFELDQYDQIEFPSLTPCKKPNENEGFHVETPGKFLESLSSAAYDSHSPYGTQENESILPHSSQAQTVTTVPDLSKSTESETLKTQNEKSIQVVKRDENDNRSSTWRKLGRHSINPKIPLPYSPLKKTYTRTEEPVIKTNAHKRKKVVKISTQVPVNKQMSEPPPLPPSTSANNTSSSLNSLPPPPVSSVQILEKEKEIEAKKTPPKRGSRLLAMLIEKGRNSLIKQPILNSSSQNPQISKDPRISKNPPDFAPQTSDFLPQNLGERTQTVENVAENIEVSKSVENLEESVVELHIIEKEAEEGETDKNSLKNNEETKSKRKHRQHYRTPRKKHVRNLNFKSPPKKERKKSSKKDNLFDDTPEKNNYSSSSSKNVSFSSQVDTVLKNGSNLCPNVPKLRSGSLSPSKNKIIDTLAPNLNLSSSTDSSSHNLSLSPESPVKNKLRNKKDILSSLSYSVPMVHMSVIPKRDSGRSLSNK